MASNAKTFSAAAVAIALAMVMAGAGHRPVYARTAPAAPQAANGAASSNAALGLSVYQSRCMVCHRDNRAGMPPVFPSLIDVDKRLTQQQIITMIHSGKGAMPSFPNLQDPELAALLEYLRTGSGGASIAPASSAPQSPVNHSSVDPAGAATYAKNCAICHGEKLEGIVPGFPALVGVTNRLNAEQIVALVRSGKGRMPAFDAARISDDQLKTLMRFLSSQSI